MMGGEKMSEENKPKENPMKSKKELMSKEDARDEIVSWADALEIDSETDGFNDVVDEIQFAVRKERLSFNHEENNFKYALLVPIEKKDQSDPISIVTISEMTMQQKKVIQRFKENEGIDQAVSLLAAALGMEDQVGFVQRIKDRDSTIINAVLTGFFMGANK